jgi:hypothetical protein
LSINYPIPTKVEIKKVLEELESNGLVFDKASSSFIDVIHTELTKIQKELKYTYQYLYLVNQTKAESAIISENKAYIMQNIKICAWNAKVVIPD